MRHELCISSNAELRCHWLLQICLMNFYGHVDKYANEPKTIVQQLYKCFVAVVTRSTTKLFYSCFVVGCFIFVVTNATTKLLYNYCRLVL